MGNVLSKPVVKQYHRRGHGGRVLSFEVFNLNVTKLSMKFRPAGNWEHKQPLGGKGSQHSHDLCSDGS